MTSNGAILPDLLPTPPSPRVHVGIAVVLVAVHLCGLLAWRSANSVSCPPGSAQLRLDPNRATAAELDLLPEIGPTLATRIVSYRASASRRPAFRTADDLDRVPGIGPATVAAIRPYLELPDGDFAFDESRTP